MVSGHWTQSKGLRPDLRLLSAGFFYARPCIECSCVFLIYFSLWIRKGGVTIPTWYLQKARFQEPMLLVKIPPPVDSGAMKPLLLGKVGCCSPHCSVEETEPREGKSRALVSSTQGQELKG